MKRIVHCGIVYAWVLSADDCQPGAKFFSEPDWPLQVGLMSLPSGHAIAPHVHLAQESLCNTTTQEFLFVVNGKMEVAFFNDAGKRFHSEILLQGEALFHLRGGHAFRFLEPTRLIEVKSGPYRGREKDKVMLEHD